MQLKRRVTRRFTLKAVSIGYLPVFNQESRYLDPDHYPIDRATAVPARRGQVLFFHYLTIHGSDINYSKQIRKIVLIQEMILPIKASMANITEGTAKG